MDGGPGDRGPDAQGEDLKQCTGESWGKACMNPAKNLRVNWSFISRKILIGSIWQVVYKKLQNDHKMPM